MAEKLIKIYVISPEGAIYEGSAKLVVLRGAEGELGISAGHAQLLTSIAPGPLRMVLEDDKEDILFVAGGILEVQPDQIIVLADVVERPMDVNESAAQEAKQKAEALLKDASLDKISINEAQLMLAEAEARLKVLALLKGASIK
jgi:F-type H+-transporting ATPase subunit epsilon